MTFTFLVVDSQEFAIAIAVVRDLKHFENVFAQVSNAKEAVKT